MAEVLFLMFILSFSKKFSQFYTHCFRVEKESTGNKWNILGNNLQKKKQLSFHQNFITTCRNFLRSNVSTKHKSLKQL